MMNKKEYGIVYTPEWIVKHILSRTILGHTKNIKICDPSCGDGAFLSAVVDMLCGELPHSSLTEALRGIWGFDIDEQAVEACRRRLDGVLNARGVAINIDWNVKVLDATCPKKTAPFISFFDYVVGNPPYVRIQHLGKDRREQIQKHWTLASRGSTDLYIAFFALGMKMLKKGGRLGFITPNTYTKSKAGERLRHFILSFCRLHTVVDFGCHQVFNGATTYAMITILDKLQPASSYELFHYDGKKIMEKGMASTRYLSKHRTWILATDDVQERIRSIEGRGIPLGCLCDIHVGVQTLADSVFILEREIAKQHRIEAGILKPIVKASVLKGGKDVKDRVLIVPYMGGKLMEEAYLSAAYPLCYKYLLSHKEVLLHRDKGSIPPNKWYGYGREMALEKMYGEKILTSPMNKKPNFQRCQNAAAIFYSGYCMKPKNGTDMALLLRHLNSEDMEFYIRHTSRDYQNGWKSYAKSFIRRFGIPDAAKTLSIFEHESTEA